MKKVSRPRNAVVITLAFSIFSLTFTNLAFAVTNSSYTSSGTIYVTNTFTDSAAVENWTVPFGVSSIDAMAVGGGGGGGMDGGNGGGGGELRVLTGQSVAAGDVLSITVASGGSGAIWGGAASSSGGVTYLKKGATTFLQANGGASGTGWSSAQNTAAGGSGGTGGTGSNGGSGGLNRYQQNEGIGGNGSAGPTTVIPTGSAVNYGGGGGGGSCWNSINSSTVAGATGGAGGGGNGAGHTYGSGSPNGSNGQANTGGGGGGGAACDGGTTNGVNQRTNGGNGGSGIVVIRYALTAASTPDLASASDTGESSTDNLTSNTTLTFTGTAIGGATVQLFVDGVSSGSSCIANSATGAYSCTTGTLSAGSRSVVARSTLSGSSIDSSALVVRIDSTTPTFSSASVAANGLSLTMVYNETISATTAAASSFTITIGGSETRTISAVSVSNSNIILTISTNIFVNQVVTISYTDPTVGNDANALQDISGNDAISLTNQSVTNNSTQKQSQATLTLAGGSMAYGSTLKLAATGGSGTGAISYSVASGNCSIVNTDSLTATSSGTCTVTATKASDSNYLVSTSSAATYTITIGTTSATISLAIGNLQFRTAKNISATASVSGKITFRSNNQIIAGCKNLTAVANVAKSCSYRPNVRGYVTITVTLVPTDSSYQSSVTRSDRYFVYARSGSRQ